MKSYLRDTTDFLNHLPSEISENTLLVSFDVQSLYSNIPHQLGEKAIHYWLRKFPNDCSARFPKEFILDGINFIITNNIFCFDSKHYRQTKGMAMGTKFAPVYATLVIRYLEEILYDKINVKYGIQVMNEFVKNWKRFLADCFILWTKSKQELLDFEKMINSLHPDIRFTIECSDKQLPFIFRCFSEERRF